jgi:hypothetical protein
VGSWQSFYQMTGEAAATLIGLLFIVASLTPGRRDPAQTQGVALFTSPTVFHLVSVLVVSALALAPDGGTVPAWIMTLWAAGSLPYAVFLAVRIGMKPKQTHWSDFWWYGAAPAAAYTALAGADASVLLRAPHAAIAVGLCLLVLLVMAFRNAWDLVTWLAPRRDGAGTDAPP